MHVCVCVRACVCVCVCACVCVCVCVHVCVLRDCWGAKSKWLRVVAGNRSIAMRVKNRNLVFMSVIDILKNEPFLICIQAHSYI